jgi:hypothetical protein
MLNPYPLHEDAQKDRMIQHKADMARLNHKLLIIQKEMNKTFYLSIIFFILLTILFFQIRNLINQ